MTWMYRAVGHVSRIAGASRWVIGSFQPHPASPGLIWSAVCQGAESKCLVWWDDDGVKGVELLGVVGTARAKVQPTTVLSG